eukprot:7848598-Pyramimonas_sp.AAC.1
MQRGAIQVVGCRHSVTPLARDQECDRRCARPCDWHRCVCRRAASRGNGYDGERAFYFEVGYLMSECVASP